MRVCVCVCDLKHKLGKNKLATIANIDAGKSDAGKRKGKNSEKQKKTKQNSFSNDESATKNN